MGLVQTIPPTKEPVSPEEAKQHLRLINDDDIQAVQMYLTMARETFEHDTGRQFCSSTWELTLDRWCDRIPAGETADIIEIPRPPLASITSITYVDPDGVTQTLATSVYEAVTNVEPGRVRLKWDQVWPSHRSQQDAIKVTFVAGYGEPATVPLGIKAAILLLLTDYYENREAINIGNLVNILPAYQRLVNYFAIRRLP